MALVLSGTLVGLGQRPALGEDATVGGSAYGYFTSVSLLGAAAAPRGPGPAVTLPPGGSAAPVTAAAATGSAVYGSATIFSSGPLSATTRGTAGPAGSITSTATVSDVDRAGDEVFTATKVTSTCSASEAGGAKGSTALTGGTLRTSEGDPDVEGDETVLAVPADPEPNLTIEGEIGGGGDAFRYVFNEQIVNGDGSITVNAAHQYLLGPTAVGELVVGHSACEMSPGASPGRPSPPTARVPDGPLPGSTPTTVAHTPLAGAEKPSAPPVARPRTIPAAAPAILPTQATDMTGPGAFGYTSKVGLFGGPAETRPCADPPANKADCRPRPAVTLPSGGSTSPVTDTVPTADARYGPGIIFTSGAITVSSQGTAASSTSKVDVQKVNTSGQEAFTAASLASTCTGSSGSTTIGGGVLRTSEGTNFDSDTDDTNVPIPASPPPNTVHEGKLESLGDSFRMVFNEQIKKDGSITVNAVHMFLLGPTAIGELTVGQSRCGANAVSTSGPPPAGASTPGAGTSGAGTSGARASGAGATTGAGAARTGPGMATTGFGAFVPLLLATTLLALGTAASIAGARLRSIASGKPSGRRRRQRPKALGLRPGAPVA